MALPLLAVNPWTIATIAGIAGMFVGSQIDDAVERPPESPTTETPATTISTAIKWSLMAGAAFVAVKAVQNAKEVF